MDENVYLFLDAYYEQVREDGQVRYLAVLVAVGINPSGKREILRFRVPERARSALSHQAGARAMEKLLSQAINTKNSQ